MDSRNHPEEYEAETDGAPFFEALLGKACFMIVIAICTATLLALVGAVIGG